MDQKGNWVAICEDGKADDAPKRAGAIDALNNRGCQKSEDAATSVVREAGGRGPGSHRVHRHRRRNGHRRRDVHR